ncbi:MAG: hypothetical protein HFF50_06520 [Lawsonibacter sp.]|nr:hypothetical protein [Lawsonibacter sp.]
MKQGRKKRVMWYAVIFTLNAVIWLLNLLRVGMHDALSLFTLSMFIRSPSPLRHGGSTGLASKTIHKNTGGKTDE